MEYSDNSIEEEVFHKTDLVDFIYKDKSLYRVADFASPSPNVSAYFFLENVNGYHAAKLRVFQDIMDYIEGGSTSNITSSFLILQTIGISITIDTLFLIYEDGLFANLRYIQISNQNWRAF